MRKEEYPATQEVKEGCDTAHVTLARDDDPHLVELDGLLADGAPPPMWTQADEAPAVPGLAQGLACTSSHIKTRA